MFHYSVDNRTMYLSYQTAGSHKWTLKPIQLLNIDTIDVLWLRNQFRGIMEFQFNTNINKCSLVHGNGTRIHHNFNSFNGRCSVTVWDWLNTIVYYIICSNNILYIFLCLYLIVYIFYLYFVNKLLNVTISMLCNILIFHFN